MNMITHPTASELARSVTQWIDEVRPQLDERNAYLARVAMNALAILDRELAQRDAAESAITPRLAELLGAEGSYESLTRDLCEQLRQGKMHIATPSLRSILRNDTLARLAIDQPNYRHEKMDR